MGKMSGHCKIYVDRVDRVALIDDCFIRSNAHLSISVIYQFTHIIFRSVGGVWRCLVTDPLWSVYGSKSFIYKTMSSFCQEKIHLTLLPLTPQTMKFAKFWREELKCLLIGKMILLQPLLWIIRLLSFTEPMIDIFVSSSL